MINLVISRIPKIKNLSKTMFRFKKKNIRLLLARKLIGGNRFPNQIIKRRGI